ncbi:MAG: DUF1257 domain-containing protein [Cyanobacteriota bacterium]|nr:DUF1257 domain-containing protein [Cyanobacteriota bacterium]
MSHLTILPTVLRDAALLFTALESLHLSPLREGTLRGFGGEHQPVDVLIHLNDGLCLGWRRQADGSLGLVGDLQRLNRSNQLAGLLSKITRTYAAHLALREAAAHLPGVRLELVG